MKLGLGERGAWGYSTAQVAEEFEYQVRELVTAIQLSPVLAGYCYTQFSDTRQEANGLVDAARKPKLPIATIRSIVLGDNVVPEFLQEDCTPEKLAGALGDLIGDTPQRWRQLEAFAQLDVIMSTGDRTPGELAADIALATMRRRPFSNSAL